MIKQMKKAKLTPIVNGEELKSFEIDLLSVNILFRYRKGKTEMWAAGLKNGWLQIKESKEQIEAFQNANPKKYNIRDTKTIVLQGNTDRGRDIEIL